jgi:hypothetical protein
MFLEATPSGVTLMIQCDTLCRRWRTFISLRVLNTTID